MTIQYCTVLVRTYTSIDKFYPRRRVLIQNDCKNRKSHCEAKLVKKHTSTSTSTHELYKCHHPTMCTRTEQKASNKTKIKQAQQQATYSTTVRHSPAPQNLITSSKLSCFLSVLNFPGSSSSNPYTAGTNCEVCLQYILIVYAPVSLTTTKSPT